MLPTDMLGGVALGRGLCKELHSTPGPQGKPVGGRLVVGCLTPTVKKRDPPTLSPFKLLKDTRTQGAFPLEFLSLVVAVLHHSWSAATAVFLISTWASL